MKAASATGTWVRCLGAWLLLFSVPASADYPVCTCPAPGPVDLPNCTCYVDGGGDWPLVPVVGDIVATALRTVGAKSSCFRHRGQPYWQVQQQISSPALARLLQQLYPSVTVESPAEAWCTETIAYWANASNLPYPGGYATLWHHTSSYVKYTTELREWFQTEEALAGFQLFTARGRWIDGSELDQADFEPGINGPCPGAYQQLEGWNDSTLTWLGSGNAHSQLVDSMIVYRFENTAGNVVRIDLTMVEGNSGSETIEECDPDLGKPRRIAADDTTFSQSRISNDHRYTDIGSLTTLGSNWIGAKKIRGWGIHLKSNGAVDYDPDRIRTVIVPLFFPTPIPVGADTSGFFRVSKLLNFAHTTHGQVTVTTNSSLVSTGGTIPGAGATWVFPAGSYPVNPVFVNVDLRAEHPYPVRGVVIQWKNGKVPPVFEVWWANGSGQPHVRTVFATPSAPALPAEVVPVPVAFPATLTMPIRYARLGIPATLLTQTYEVVGWHFDYAVGDPEDHNDVFRDEQTIPTDARPVLAPAVLVLRSAMPNPFNPSVTIRFALPRRGRARLVVHDVRGRVVTTLVDALRDAGEHRSVWDGLDVHGKKLASGVYFARLTFDDEMRTQKLVLLR